MAFQHFNTRRSGFTLIEVILALGVFLVSVMALIGLLGPMLQSIDKVEQIDEITSVVSTVNAFLQSSPDIAQASETKFDTIYELVASDSHATLFVFRYYDDDSAPEDAQLGEQIRLEIGFSPDQKGSVGEDSDVDPELFTTAAGPIYRVVLTASSLTPPTLRTSERSDGIFTLTESLSDYPEGYLALEARVFAEDPPGPSSTAGFEGTDLSELNNKEPDFTFNTAIVR